MTALQGRSSDKTALSPRRRYRETPEVVAAIRRLVRVVGKRISTEDPDGLRLLVELENEVAAAWRQAIDGLRRTGFSDSDIGAELGCTKQAIAQRWPRDAGAS